MKASPNVRPPPRGLVLAIERSAPGFWSQFTSAVDRGLSEHPDAVLTSWWRDSAHNADVGGAQQSQHLLGTAFDVDLPTEAGKLAVADSLRRAGFLVLVHAVPGGKRHVHAQAWPSGAADAAGLFRLVRR